ncbi:MAG: chromate transporter [Verrucomicrobia bacterium]|nr:chromate transporter [Verrucomicrobiota bacterium]
MPVEAPNPDQEEAQASFIRVKVSLLEIAGLFGFIGITSFGGGLTAYIRRLVVGQKQWLTDEEFLPGLALVQILPGANVAGLSIYIGNHLRGPLGAAVALTSILVPPFVLVCILGFLYFHAGKTTDTRAVLAGITATACGLMASMVFEAGQKAIRGAFDIVLILLTFALVRFAHLHVPYVILIMAPLAIWWHRPRPQKTTEGIKP